MLNSTRPAFRRNVLLFLLLAGWPADTVWSQGAGDAALQRMAAQLLPQVERLSNLKAKRPLHIAQRTRAQLRAHVARQQEERVASGEMQAIETVYKRLGLLPDAFDLKTDAARFMTEQLAGYYDPRTDTLYVLNDIPASAVRSVLVHEMVHALQGQHIPMDSLLTRQAGNDRQSAARAAIEGHATLVMLLYQAEAAGRRLALAELPDLSRFPLELLSPTQPSRDFLSAPLILREGGVFPYARGAGFVQAVWKREPGAAPFANGLPLSTEQVLNPERKFLGEQDHPTEILLGDPGEPAAGWKAVYQNTLGQFELATLIKERHPQVGAERYAQGWDGDRYLLVSDGKRHALLWYLLWDDPGTAYDFAQTYRQILHLRLGKSAAVEELTVDGRPVVRIVEAEDGVDLAGLPKPTIRFAASP